MSYGVIWNAKDYTSYLEGYWSERGFKPKYFWVFKYPTSGKVWCYAATETADYREIGEGHVRLALRDGWIPERISLEEIKAAA